MSCSRQVIDGEGDVEGTERGHVTDRVTHSGSRGLAQPAARRDGR
jgi:hypothetical protein